MHFLYLYHADAYASSPTPENLIRVKWAGVEWRKQAYLPYTYMYVFPLLNHDNSIPINPHISVNSRLSTYIIPTYPSTSLK